MSSTAIRVSNLRFAGDEAVAIIDLDTRAYGTIDAELGDGATARAKMTRRALMSPFWERFARLCAGTDLTDAEWASVVPRAHLLGALCALCRDVEERYLM